MVSAQENPDDEDAGIDGCQTARTPAKINPGAVSSAKASKSDAAHAFQAR
jgi:hypothetical protein